MLRVNITNVDQYLNSSMAQQPQQKGGSMASKQSVVSATSLGGQSVGNFKTAGSLPLRKIPGIKTYPPGQVPPEAFLPLEKVIGMSSKGTNSIAVNPVTGDIAYPAGAVICIYNPKENKQVKFLYNQTLQRSYSCLAYSPDGLYLAAGEGAFKLPEITIWEIDQVTQDYVERKHLKGHKYGIESVMFSPNMLYLISLGDANDRGLFVWDWRNEKRRTSNKLGKPVNNFCFAQSSEFFVTAGYQHLKYWHFDEEENAENEATEEPVERIMESKSADLTKVKVKIFVGVQCVQNGGPTGKDDQVLALASDGHLYVYDKNRKLSKWMSIKVDRALSCAVGGSFLYCACTEGIVRIFNTKSLEFIMTIPKPPPLGQANVDAGKKIRIATSKDAKFADAIGVQVDEKNQRVLVLYSDKMVFIWDVKQKEKISVFRTLYSHSGAIYDMQYVPNSLSQIGMQAHEGGFPEEELTGLTKFATCSADRTVRFWYFVDPQSGLQPAQVNKMVVKNAYSKDMSRMIYVSSESRDSSGNLVTPLNFHQQFKVSPIVLNEDGTPKQEDPSMMGSRDFDQLRCIKFSPDGKHLACGDWGGNIRIHDLDNSTYEEVQCIQAHDGEIVCLDYSPLSYDTSRTWLASGSRDRLTQVYERQPNQLYQNVAILDDHSSTISSVKFIEEKSATTVKKRLKLVTSGNDKMVVMRAVSTDQPDGSLATQVIKTEHCKAKVFSMDVTGSGHAITGHDKYLQLWTTTQQGALEKTLERRIESSKKQAVLDSLRVSFGAGLGHQNNFADIFMASCADKTVTLYETLTGNIVSRTTCGEVTLAMCLSTNLRHLITASMEGIIYIWKLPENLSKALLKLRTEQHTVKKTIQPIPQQMPEIKEEAKRKASEEFDFSLQRGEDQPHQEQLSIMDESSMMLDESQLMHPPPTISFIMNQINKVAGQIDKIQPIKSRAHAPSNEEPFLKASPEQPQLAMAEPLAHKRRNPWGPQQQPQAPINFTEQAKEEDPMMDTAELLNARPMQVKENKLPRWAQSMAGDSAMLLKKSINAPEQVNEDEELEDIFSNTLEKHLAHSEDLYPPHEQEGKEEENEEEEDLAVTEHINKMRLRQRKQIGLEDEEEESKNENRQSQSQLFFQRRRQVGKDEEDQEAKVEDIFNESTVEVVSTPVVDVTPVETPDVKQTVPEIATMIVLDEDQNNASLEFVPRESESHTDLQEPRRHPLIDLIDESIADSDASLVKLAAPADALIEQELETINAALQRIQQSLGQRPVKSEVLDKLGKSMELFNTVSQQVSQQHPQLMTFNNAHRDSSMSTPLYAQSNNQSLLSMVSIKEDARDLLERYSDLLMQEVLKKLQK